MRYLEVAAAAAHRFPGQGFEGDLHVGNDLVLAGNIDKRALIQGGAQIDREVEKVKTLLSHGGYFPAVDHSVPPDVPLENFAYLLQCLRDL